MTQPAKAQEPSMEEILASIRRIISDDEAKPTAPPAETAKAESASASSTPSPPATPPPAPPLKAVTPQQAAAPARPVMTGIPPSRLAVARPAPAPAPAEKNSQDDIDALLAGFDNPAPEPAPAAASGAIGEDRSAAGNAAEEDLAGNASGEDASDLDAIDDEVFELTEQMAIQQTPAGFRKLVPEDDLEFAENAALTPQSHTTRMAPPLYDQPASATTSEVLSGATAAAVESAFNALANTVLSNNARTLEDLVKDMLRPMLKSWLDDNLPNLVERIVRAEIERVARGR